VPHVISTTELAHGRPVARFEGRDHGASVSFFVGSFAPGKGPGLHRHPYEETFVIHAGRARFSVDGATVEAGAGDIVVVPAEAAHKFVSCGDTDLCQVSIHPADHMTQQWIEA
jgi:quercetin dioxygenase-like cupin family protein